MRIILSVLIISVLLTGRLSAQDTITYLNGKTKVCEVTSVNKTEMTISVITDKEKNEIRMMEMEDVYSISYKDSIRDILYVQDTNMGFYYTPEQMNSFVKGEQFADKHYKAPLITTGGIIIGAVSPYPLGFFLGLLPPVAYSGITGITSAGTNKMAEKYPDVFKDEYFVNGYKNKAGKKRFTNAIAGGALGFGIAGLTSVILFIAND